jgi:hypothetical protein
VELPGLPEGRRCDDGEDEGQRRDRRGRPKPRDHARDDREHGHPHRQVPRDAVGEAARVRGSRSIGFRAILPSRYRCLNSDARCASSPATVPGARCALVAR